MLDDPAEDFALRVAILADMEVREMQPANRCAHPRSRPGETPVEFVCDDNYQTIWPSVTQLWPLLTILGAVAYEIMRRREAGRLALAQKRAAEAERAE